MFKLRGDDEVAEVLSAEIKVHLLEEAARLAPVGAEK